MKFHTLFVATLTSFTTAVSAAALDKHGPLTVPRGVNVEKRGPTAYCSVPVRREIKKASDLVAVMALKAKDHYLEHPEKVLEFFKYVLCSVKLACLAADVH